MLVTVINRLRIDISRRKLCLRLDRMGAVFHSSNLTSLTNVNVRENFLARMQIRIQRTGASGLSVYIFLFIPNVTVPSSQPLRVVKLLKSMKVLSIVKEEVRAVVARNVAISTPSARYRSGSYYSISIIHSPDDEWTRRYRCCVDLRLSSLPRC